MTEVYMGSTGGTWVAQMVARMGSIGAAVAGTHAGTNAATAGGAYAGSVSQTYTITVTKAGATDGEITVVGSNGDNSGPTVVAGEDTWVVCGNLGAMVLFDYGDDAALTLGDTWTIPCIGIDEIKYCAIGSGDGTFTDPENPPSEIAGAGLLNEFARVHYCTWDVTRNIPGKCYLVEDVSGRIYVDGVNYSIAPGASNLILYSFVFGPTFGVGTVREWGLFADDATLRVAGQYAEHGLYDAVTNPTGEVATLGTRVVKKNIHDWPKISQDTLIVRQLFVG